jgi:ATPase subunit of ABC transporter with duplicated ATPase domains
VLHAREISRHHGAQTVLDRVTLTIGAGDRVGVVGPNGIGKSTLLRILAGHEASDGGAIERAPRTLTVGYLPQESDAVPGELLRDYLARRTGVTAAEAELDARTKAMGEDPESIGAYTDALERFLALGGDDLDARIGAVLADVGLPGDRVDVPVAALSGGQQARAALAAILLSRFDVLLLDEPTNDLDFAGLDQLEAFVASTPAAVVTVSHDREFLDRAVDRIVEITEEHHRAVEFAGGWSDFVAARDLLRTQGYEAHAKFVAERQRLVDRQRTQRAWSEEGVRSAKTKATDGDKFIRHNRAQRSEKQAAKVKATERKIDQLEAVEKPWEGWQLKLSLTPAARSGDVVARLDGAVVRRGSFILGPIDLEIAWQERLGILGPNGAGKSTLLAALLGEIELVDGRRWLGPGVRVGRMEQGRDAFDDPSPLLARFQARTGMVMSEARSLLAKFGLGADHVDRPTDRLSPGERSRAILAALMAEGVNCLVLDEPTNHLDLAAIEQLEGALAAFDGTLVLVSHDRRFLDAVGLSRTIDLAAR